MENHKLLGIFLMTSFQAFIELSSTLVFITGPMFAILNHRAVFSDEVPDDMKPGNVLKYWSLIGILILTSVALFYFYVKFSS